MRHVTDYTTDELNQAVQSNDLSVNRFFGAKLKDSPYLASVRSPMEEAHHRAIVGGWSKFRIQGTPPKAPPDGKAFLWKCVTDQLGQPFLVYDQKTGSCVGNGFGQAMNALSAVEAWQKGEPEQVLFPYFWLWDYGLSRWHIDPNDGPGEGSFGSAIAEVAVKFGMFAQSMVSGIPTFDTENNTGMTWGQQAEMAWSFINPSSSKWSQYVTQAAPHLMKTSALLKSSDEVRDAIINGYPVTTASNWGGMMQCPVVGSGANAYLQNRRSDTWPHQMSIHGYWDHPTDGELFYILNSWSIRAHGTCPTGAPKGGFWVKKNEIDWIANSGDGELIAYSQFSGYPSQQIDWTEIYRKPITYSLPSSSQGSDPNANTVSGACSPTP